MAGSFAQAFVRLLLRSGATHKRFHHSKSSQLLPFWLCFGKGLYPQLRALSKSAARIYEQIPSILFARRGIE